MEGCSQNGMSPRQTQAWIPTARTRGGSKSAMCWGGNRRRKPRRTSWIRGSLALLSPLPASPPCAPPGHFSTPRQRAKRRSQRRRRPAASERQSPPQSTYTGRSVMSSFLHPSGLCCRCYRPTSFSLIMFHKTRVLSRTQLGSCLPRLRALWVQEPRSQPCSQYLKRPPCHIVLRWSMSVFLTRLGPPWG